MVQNVSSPNQTNQFGTISKIGTTAEGRVIYQLNDAEGKPANKLSVAQAHSDTFEKSFNTILENAPKVQKFQENLTPRQAEKLKTRSKRIKWGATLTGFLVPALFVRAKFAKKEWLKSLIQATTTLAGIIAGFISGQLIAAKATTPPGSMEIAKATQTISKLDIRPFED